MTQSSSLLAVGSSWLLLLLLSPPTLEAAASSFAPPADSICKLHEWGPYPAVGKKTLEDLVDPGRNDRPVVTDVWYPAAANGEGLTRYHDYLETDGVLFKALDAPAVAAPNKGFFPLLVFSHGSTSFRAQSATLMEHLASHGFVVAAMDHAGNSMNDVEEYPYDIDDRPKDVSFVIDTLLAEPYRTDYQLASEQQEPVVGVLGNSAGGWTAVAVATGSDGVAFDPRIRATLPISPATFSQMGALTEEEEASLLSTMKIPLLVMGGQNDTTTPVDPNNAVLFDHSTAAEPRWNVVFPNAGHTSFSDTCTMFSLVETLLAGNTDLAYDMMGGIDPETGRMDRENGKRRVREAICDVTMASTLPLQKYTAAAFFQATLLGDAVATACLEWLGDPGASEWIVEYEMSAASSSSPLWMGGGSRLLLWGSALVAVLAIGL